MNNAVADFRDAVIQQKREMEQRLLDKYVARDVVHTALDAGGLIRVVIGPRRAGKSVFCLHALPASGKAGYVNFDDERLAGARNYDDVLNAVDAVYDRPDHLLLDEIQNLDQWELLVNRLHRQGRRLLVTGSNAHLLSSELATHLTGRHLTIPLLPFSFGEYLRAQGRELTDSERRSLFESYAEEGGFPEPLMTSVNRTDYLRTLVQATLYKDIVRRHRVRAVQGLEDMAHYLFSNIAKEFSYRSLSRVIRCRSVTTAEKYVRHLEESFMFFTLKRFSFKVREQAAYNKKIYAVDNGLALALGFRHSGDKGRLYENLAAIALWKRVLNHAAHIYFWKNADSEEVDFVVKEGTRITELIQVCSNMGHEETRSRELRALLKAGQELKCSNLLILTPDRDGEEDAEWFGIKGHIRFMSLWRWLLQDKASPDRGS